VDPPDTRSGRIRVVLTAGVIGLLARYSLCLPRGAYRHVDLSAHQGPLRFPREQGVTIAIRAAYDLSPTQL
jgi:hypothetical protein